MPDAGCVLAMLISIYALREEGDPYMPEVFHDVMKFLSTPSARRATDYASKVKHAQREVVSRCGIKSIVE